MAKTLVDSKSFKVVLNKQVTQEVLELLENTTLGTRGVQYAHKNTRERVKHLKNPYFLSIYRNGKIWGNITFSQREITTSHGKVNAYYIRYFAFSAGLRSSGNHRVSFKGKSPLKTMIKSIFHRGIYQADYNHGENHQLPFVYYAYIDDENLRSMNMSEAFGFEVLGKFATVTFSRSNPTRVNNISKLPIEDRPEFRSVLANYYKNYSLVDFHDLFRDNNYYTLSVKGEKIVGAQVHSCLWEVKSFGSKTKNMMLKTLSYLPGIRNWFNPDSLYFICLDHLYVNKNYEDALIPFFNGLLSIKGVNIAMMWLDLQDPTSQFFLNSKKLGPIARLQKVTPANILVNYSSNFPAEAKEEMKQQVRFLSGYDMT